MTRNDRILLSPPDVGERERQALLDAFDSGWIAPVGPQLDEFELNLAECTGAPAALALSSGSAALHLALLVSGVAAGSDVLCQSMTFAASVNAIRYAGATPVLVDSERETWNIDPALVEAELDERAKTGSPMPSAIVAVDIFGTPAGYSELNRIAAKFEVPLIADAAESLGASVGSVPVGSLASLTALSFNGNKLITTSGGGALLGSQEAIERARFLATQAREPVAHYEHREVGFNYRMSNLLAALESAQLSRLDELIAKRRKHFIAYKHAFENRTSIRMMPVPLNSEPNYWLSVALLPPELEPAAVIARCNSLEIECRQAWKPMHLQPANVDCRSIESGVASNIFKTGICLPSGSSMSAESRQRVCNAILELVEG